MGQTRQLSRLVALPCSEENVIDMVAFYSAFAEAYTALVKQEPVSCAHTGITMERAPSPTVAIIDVRNAWYITRYSTYQMSILSLDFHAPSSRYCTQKYT